VSFLLYLYLTIPSPMLNRKLLDSGLELDNFDIQLRKIRSEVELFLEENLPIQAKISEFSMEYDKIAGA